jgi:hypothetical protein
VTRKSPRDTTGALGWGIAMGKRLEALPTTVTFRQVAAALEASWTTLLGSAPKQSSLSVLLAQSALETGHWKYSYCYNLGNAKAGASWQGDYCFYPADEIVNEAQAASAIAERALRTDGVAGHDVELTALPRGQVKVTLHPDHPWCRFRAFTSLQDGADDYLGLLHKRFKAAWPAIEAGDPEGFVRTLRELGYFTASLERYLPPVQQLFDKFSKLLSDPQASVPAPASPRPLPLPVKNPTLRLGDRGPLVTQVQGILAQQGYQDVPRHGVFDEAMLRVVELFQLQHVDERGLALSSDGKIGSHTWWALLNPSGDAQKLNLTPPPPVGLTAARTSLLALLDKEHAKPVFESPDGSNRSADIDRYWGRTGVIAQPWCCAFVSWALNEALQQLPIGGKHHVSVQGMWVVAKELGMAVSAPKPGDVFIQLKSAGTGHTGFVVGVSKDGQTIYTCEGNCGNRLKYGMRSASSIHHFIDCIRDGQGDGFARGTDLKFEDLSAEGTR